MEGHHHYGQQLKATILNWKYWEVKLLLSQDLENAKALMIKSHYPMQRDPASERCHLQKTACDDLYLCVTAILGNYWRQD